MGEFEQALVKIREGKTPRWAIEDILSFGAFILTTPLLIALILAINTSTTEKRGTDAFNQSSIAHTGTTKDTELRVISAIDNNTRLSFKGRQYHVSGYNYRTKDVTMDARNGTITVPLDDIN